jgi:hypothetical protein
MAQHKLSLEALDVMNECILRIVDTSVYSPAVATDCPILEVTVPGFKYSIQFSEDTAPSIAPGFMTSLTACDLELQFENCGTTFKGLPDGIYVIKYSVSPNNVVYVEYNHLRITKALIKYEKVLCDLDIAACEPTKETDKKLEELRKIKMYLEAAKAKVETCHEPKKGMELYTYAMKLLDKFECNTCY